jgi:hypothetical protein
MKCDKCKKEMKMSLKSIRFEYRKSIFLCKNCEINIFMMIQDWLNEK